MQRFHRASPLQVIIPITVVLYLLLAVFMIFGLQYDFMRSDVLSYWKISSGTQSPFHPFHVPGYPFAIALFRGITLDFLPPVITMMLVNVVAFGTSIALVYQCVFHIRESRKSAAISAALFGLWPFAGLVFSTIPLADIPALALLLGGLYSLLHKRNLAGGFLLGLSAITHKAMWPFVALIFLASLAVERRLNGKTILAAFLMAAPILTFWVGGWIDHGSPAWILSSNIEKEISARGNLPVLDGILGTISQGGAVGLIKGGLVLGIALLALAISLIALKRRSYYALAIGLPLVAYSILLNQHEIFALVRFSRVLAVPIGWLLLSPSLIDRTRVFAAAALIILLMTQFAFAWYMARVLFA